MRLSDWLPVFSWTLTTNHTQTKAPISTADGHLIDESHAEMFIDEGMFYVLLRLVMFAGFLFSNVSQEEMSKWKTLLLEKTYRFDHFYMF